MEMFVNTLKGFPGVFKNVTTLYLHLRNAQWIGVSTKNPEIQIFSPSLPFGKGGMGWNGKSEEKRRKIPEFSNTLKPIPFPSLTHFVRASGLECHSD